jgi:cyanate permease
MLCLGFALGPLLVKIVGAGQYWLFVISAFLVLLSCFLLLFIRHQQPKPDENKIDYWQIFKNHKNSFIARFLLDLQGVVIVLFTVIYGVKNGLSAENAGILVSAFMLVGLLDCFIGWLIKNRNLQKYINIGFVGTLIFISLLPLVILNYYLAMLIYVIYGWFVSLIFIASITKVNHNQNQNDLIAINSVFQAVGGLGAFCGIILAGIFMQFFGADGFVILLVMANLTYFIVRFLPRFFPR